MDGVDVAIVGAGVIGAAVFAELTARGRSCALLDRRERAGGETTERNSGVIHAGLYYPLDAQKTRLCLLGNRLLYAWAEKHGVPHRRTEKLIVATTDAEEGELSRLLAHGRAAGVPGLSLLDRGALRALEPELEGRAALRSETTGIVDPAALTASLVASGRGAGGELVVGAQVEAIERPGEGYLLRTRARGELWASSVVNAAGLYADELARLVGVDRYTIHPCRGDYYRLARRLRTTRLVYPVKVRGAPGLGVHLTLDLAGNARLGPNATYVPKKDDYAEGGGLEVEFAAAASRFLPGITADQVAYESCGIRPKLRGPTDPEERDFVISEDLPGFVNLVGIESPGLTSALAIAREVEAILRGSPSLRAAP